VHSLSGQLADRKTILNAKARLENKDKGKK